MELAPIIRCRANLHDFVCVQGLVRAYFSVQRDECSIVIICEQRERDNHKMMSVYDARIPRPRQCARYFLSVRASISNATRQSRGLPEPLPDSATVA